MHLHFRLRDGELGQNCAKKIVFCVQKPALLKGEREVAAAAESAAVWLPSSQGKKPNPDYSLKRC